MTRLVNKFRQNGKAIRYAPPNFTPSAGTPPASGRFRIINDSGAQTEIRPAYGPGEFLRVLRKAGRRGVSADDFPPGTRIGDSVFKLRKLGVSIKTIRQQIAGASAPARYVIISRVEEILADQEVAV